MAARLKKRKLKRSFPVSRIHSDIDSYKSRFSRFVVEQIDIPEDVLSVLKKESRAQRISVEALIIRILYKRIEND